MRKGHHALNTRSATERSAQRSAIDISLPVLLPAPEETHSDSMPYASLPPLGSNVKVLMVWPSFPPSFWGFEGVLQMIPERAMTPPLGLITVAALCPATWEIRLIDHAFQELRDEDLKWADLVMVSAMHAQRADALNVLGRARDLGRRTFVGGPWASTDPDAVLLVADHVMVGEAEEAFPGIAAALENGTAHALVPHYRQARHDAQPGAPLRPAASRQIHFDAHSVLARMPLPVRVLRHHHHLRPAAAGEDTHPGDS